MQLRLLVSAGPSREPIDDVRFLSNASTGAMGIAVADAAAARGWRVDLALGPTHLLPSRAEVIVHRFVTATDLDAIARELWPGVDAFVATAAVCDYRPRERSAGKRKKTPGDWQLGLVRNPDVLALRGRERAQRTIVGFALEATHDVDEAQRKLVEKNLDLIILNTTAALDMANASAGDVSRDDSVSTAPPPIASTLQNATHPSIEYRWISRAGEEPVPPSLTKAQLAARIVEFIARERGAP